MAENSITSPVDFAAHENGASETDPQLHDLLPFTIAGHLFAIFAEQVDGTAEGKSFARLPRAPRGIIGVVCVRGRMLTVLDPAALLNNEPAIWERSLPYVIVLRGDEQLGLAAETCRDTITISAADIEQPSDQNAAPDELALGLVRYAGEEMVLLDGNRLFGRAVQHRERRRRRF
jgi:purine-binding chemotaxis protein CheW